MGLLNVLILALAALGPILQGVYADCVLSTETPRPQIITHFGSKVWLTKAKEHELPSVHGSTIELYCPNGFQYNSNYGAYAREYHQMKLVCSNNGWKFSDSDPTPHKNIRDIYCSVYHGLEMYESELPMPNCENFMSLVVGYNLRELGSLKNFAMCYDINKRQLKYASYTAYPSKVTIIEKTQVGQLNQLGMDIAADYTRTLDQPISASMISDQFKKDKNLRELFDNTTYEYATLIQDESFAEDLMSLNDMLGIVWLRALRTGNWRHLLNALRIASLNAYYDVNVGVSGTVTLPTLRACNETRFLYIELDSGDIVWVPAHIWAHIRALNGTDDFVVVAHNTPFFTSNERDGLCKSMCDEVSWLKNSMFNKLRHYPVYGLVQCCRVSEVENLLDNFPKQYEPPMAVESLELTEESTETS